jgi:hypothetical protein
METVEVQKFTFKATAQYEAQEESNRVSQKTTFNEGTKLYTTTVVLSRGFSEFEGIGISDNVGASIQAAEDNASSKMLKESTGAIIVTTYGDGVEIRDQQFGSPPYTLETAVSEARSGAETFGVVNRSGTILYLLAKEVPEAPEPPLPEVSSPAPREMYIPATRMEEPKFTPGEEFVVRDTGEPYKGFYVKSFKDRFYSGKTPENLGAELLKVVQTSDELEGGLTRNLLSILLELAKGVFNRRPTASEKKAGKMKRYFVKDKNTSKINETTKDTFLQAKQLPNRIFAEMDWIIKGPAEDTTFNGITYFGAESRNREAVRNLEKTLPGISNYIQQYKYLVEPTSRVPQVPGPTGTLAGTVEGANYGTNAAIGPQQSIKSTKDLQEEAIQQKQDFTYLTQTPDRADKRRLSSRIAPERDFLTELENSRKASFDTRK